MRIYNDTHPPIISTAPISNFFAQVCFHDANSAGNEYNRIK